MYTKPAPVTQCQKPSGWLGRLTLRRMNKSHSKLTDWGLTHLSIRPHDTILDVGCGGGRTVGKLVALAGQGKVFGVDYSAESVAFSQKTNASFIQSGQVEIRQASVSQLPFPDGAFDLITAIETHIWWPSLATDVPEVFRVTKPGGQFAFISEVYKGAASLVSRLAEKHASRTGMNLLSVDEHRQLLSSAGFTDIQIDTQPNKGWICAVGKKP